MNKETIDCQVVMLPRNTFQYDKSAIVVNNGKLGFNFWMPENSIQQHLYFTSNDPITYCDWCKHNLHHTIFKISSGDSERTVKQASRFCKKIIASTDPSLGLPTIPESLVKDYVAANGKIDKVLLKQYLTGAPPKPKLYTTDNNEVVVVGFEGDLTVNEFMHKLKHEVSYEQRKDWARANSHRIVFDAKGKDDPGTKDEQVLSAGQGG